MRYIQNSHVKKKVSLEEQRAQKEDRFLRGRWIGFVIYDYFRVTGAHDVSDYADLFSVTLHDDNIQEFEKKMGWSCTINVKDSIRWYPGKSAQIENTWVRTTQNCVGIVRHGDSSDSFDAIHWKNWRQRWRGISVRNFDYETLTHDTGELKQEQWSKIVREWVALKDEKVPVTIGKKKASVRKESDAVSGMRVKIMQKTDTKSRHTFWGILVTGMELCRGKEVSEAKVNMLPFFDNRADVIWRARARDRRVNIGILPSVKFFTKQKRVAKQEMSVCSRIKRLVNNQTKSQRKATIHTKEEKATTRTLWLLWNCSTIGLRLARLGCVGFSKRQTVPGKPDAKSLGIDSKSTVHSVYATSSRYPGKERTVAWKLQVKHPHQRSPYAMKFEDRSSEETERQQRCARSKAWNLAKNIYKLKEKDKTTFYSPRKNGDSRLHQQKSQCKESLWWILERVCIWSVKETLTLLSWRPWGHREVRRRWWRPTARCKQEKKPRKMSKNWTYSWRLCFLKLFPQFFLSGRSARIMGTLTTGPALKNHISPKRARELIAICQTMCHS